MTLCHATQRELHRTTTVRAQTTIPDVA